MPILNMIYWATWWGGWWKPWANTIAYYPLDTDFNDASWNGYNLTNSWGTITTSDWVACAYFSWSSNVMASASISVTTQDSTFAFWMKKMRHTNNERFIHRTNDNIEQAIAWRWTQWQLNFINWQNWWRSNGYNSNTPEWQWIFVVGTWWSSWNKAYLNWVEQTLSYLNGNASSTALSVTYSDIVLGNNRWWSQPWQCYLSNVIIENKVWTADEVSEYYNLTKSNYWL